MDTIYIEEEVKNHPRVLALLKKLKSKRVVLCDKYTEIFNRKNQSFRLQKNRPGLILAKKYSSFLHPIPESFAIGGKRNFYFSHLLNCPYDCQYCFLQGLYRSSYYVFFVNLEDFQAEILKQSKLGLTYFFSGYDADSLALEKITHFVEESYSFFKNTPQAFLEIRTKSNFILPLLKRKPLENWIIAYTLSPKKIASTFELKAPSLEKRLQCIELLQKKGWQIGLRFDPVLWVSDFEIHYSEFFSDIFRRFDLNLIHSITLGTFRLPKSLFQNMKTQIANQSLLATIDQIDTKTYSYQKKIKERMLDFCKQTLLKKIGSSKLFITDNT